ncbi:MAG: hypothetical protein RSN61_21335 [Chryseobacterium sp.]|uniref:hypothetical protein n=1 Tax=Chryseobacterium sp. TaxID=1871047 RepID=UPI002FC7F453
MTKAKFKTSTNSTMFASVQEVADTILVQEKLLQDAMRLQVLKASAIVGALVDEINKIGISQKIAIRTALTISIDEDDDLGFTDTATGYFDKFQLLYIDKNEAEIDWKNSNEMYLSHFYNSGLYENLLKGANTVAEKKRFRRFVDLVDELKVVEGYWSNMKSIALLQNILIKGETDIEIRDNFY